MYRFPIVLVLVMLTMSCATHRVALSVSNVARLQRPPLERYRAMVHLMCATCTSRGDAESIGFLLPFQQAVELEIHRVRSRFEAHHEVDCEISGIRTRNVSGPAPLEIYADVQIACVPKAP